MNYAIIVIGGMMSWPQRYEEMRTTLAELSGNDIPIVSLYPTDWARLFRIEGWDRLLATAERALFEESQRRGARLVVVGHSLGGIVGRLLGNHNSINGKSYAASETIGAVVGLGSPFQSQRVFKTLKLGDLLAGESHEVREVPCLAVAGQAVKGNQRGSLAERYAYQAYKWHIGRGDVDGDSMIPEPSILIEGVKGLRLKGVYHEKFVSASWYCAPAVVSQWWPYLVEFLDGIA